jgi:hypothetical protein
MDCGEVMACTFRFEGAVPDLALFVAAKWTATIPISAQTRMMTFSFKQHLTLFDKRGYGP